MDTLKCLAPAENSHNLIRIYQQHKENCVSHIHSEFAFAIYDKQKQTIFAARDPIGLNALYYTFIDGKYSFSNDMGELFLQTSMAKKASTQTMAGIINGSSIPYTETMYEGVHRLPPGHYMTISADGVCSLVRYWKPEAIQIDYTITIDSAVDKFKQLFGQAISDRIDDPDTTACELSGGLDSSSVVSWIKSSQPDYKLTCLSMTFDSLEQCDESAYVDEIDKTFDINLIKLQTDTLDYKKKLNFDYNYTLNPHWPQFINNTIGLPLVEEARKNGIKTILTGQGGDHIMAGNLYCLHDYLKQFRWHLILREMMAFRKPLQLTKHFILKPFLSEKTLSFVRNILYPSRDKNPQKRQRPDTRFEQLTELYTGKSLSFKYDLAQVLGSNNSALYENSYYHIAEQKYGIKFRHPFFDRRLIEFMLSLPPELKLSRGRSKYLLREALKGILPDKVRLRNSKAMFNDALKQQIDAADIDTFLQNAHIAKLGLIEQSRIDELRRKYRSAELTNLVYFWQIINLEYWYRFNFVSPPVMSPQVEQ